MTTRDERYRRAAHREHHRAEHYRKQFLNLAAVLLLEGRDMASVLDDDDLADARKRARQIAADRAYAGR